MVDVNLIADKDINERNNFFQEYDELFQQYDANTSLGDEVVLKKDLNIKQSYIKTEIKRIESDLIHFNKFLKNEMVSMKGRTVSVGFANKYLRETNRNMKNETKYLRQFINDLLGNIIRQNHSSKR